MEAMETLPENDFTRYETHIKDTDTVVLIYFANSKEDAEACMKRWKMRGRVAWIEQKDGLVTDSQVVELPWEYELQKEKSN